MSASESKAQSERRPRPYVPVAGVSMRDLLAAGAAANVISTPPRLPDPETNRRAADHGHREAA
ncbi:hypothetical protein QQM39_16785 [Streptomyces sp. DT2A-34]|uniref:hypothetical protein n=1 Tax=Streptomyces sp. DT2A-34 TaxID=3051182 RepID=UPI00265C52D8|nr:hypothetical protein [Streptomyces sp. DT2A-34]MDO0912445.1 hypothetical protein [Streptomyces sp. DT2A-34]